MAHKNTSRHMLYLKLQVTLILILSCASCSSFYKNLIVNDLGNLPPYIVKIDSGAKAQHVDWFCVVVDQAKLFERGNSVEQISDTLLQTAQLLVDGESASKDESWGFIDLSYSVVLDENNQALGSYGADTHLCFNVENLEVGEHTATFSVESVSGTEYTYSWSFEVSRVFELSD